MVLMNQKIHDFENSEDDEDDLCPICIEPLIEKGDTNIFLPCECNYRVCMFCVRRIRTEFDNRCPGCRRHYEEERFRFVEDLSEKSRKGKKVASTKLENRPASVSQPVSPAQSPRSSQSSHGNISVSLNASNAPALTPVWLSEHSGRELSNIRVVQKNLVYLVGLSPRIAKDEILRSDSFFGQYGKIIKVAINRNEYKEPQADGRSPACSAYITFARDDYAESAIRAVNGFRVDNYVIKASYGTTKYCNMFLRGLSCGNPDCLYLHQLGDDASSFTKEEMQTGVAGFHYVTQVRSQFDRSESSPLAEGSRTSRQRIGSVAGSDDSLNPPDRHSNERKESFQGSSNLTSAWGNGKQSSNSQSLKGSTAVKGSRVKSDSFVDNGAFKASSVGWASVAAGNAAAAAIPPSELVNGTTGSAYATTNRDNDVEGSMNGTDSKSGDGKNGKMDDASRASGEETTAVSQRGGETGSRPDTKLIKSIPDSFGLGELRSSALLLEEYIALHPNVGRRTFRPPGPPNSSRNFNFRFDFMLNEIEGGIAQLNGIHQRMRRQNQFESQQKHFVVQGQQMMPQLFSPYQKKNIQPYSQKLRRHGPVRGSTWNASRATT